MGAACGAGTHAETPGPRKRNCTLGVTEEHTLDLTQQASPQKALGEDPLLSDADDAWQVGNRYQLQASACQLREAPQSDSSVVGDLKPSMIVVLLKVAKDEESEGRLWGYLDPPAGSKGPVAGWAILEGEGCGEGSKLAARKLDLCWEVGRVYEARKGTVLRAGAEFSSEKLSGMQRGDKVEVLELCVLEGAVQCKTKLRAKVLVWRTREIGWLSPRSADGVHLLRDFKIHTLEMAGRLTRVSVSGKRTSIKSLKSSKGGA